MSLYDIVQNLPDDKQRDAIQKYKRCVMIAGPGSGKTYRLVLKIAYLLGQEIKPMQQIACITYMNDAVREIENRISQFGFENDNRLFIGTVHKFCITAIILPFKSIFLRDWSDNLHIADEDIQLDILKSMYPSKGRRELKNLLKSIREIRIHQLFNEYHSFSKADAENSRVYLEKLRQQGYVDFDDIAIEAFRLVMTQPIVRNYLVARYPWLVIDEYQDLGRVFNALVSHLIKHTNVNFFIVGDTNQSIMGFQGANPQDLEDLAKYEDIEKVSIRITRRCLPHIIEAANKLLPEKESPIETIHTSDGNRKLNYKYCPNGIDEQIQFICKQIQYIHHKKTMEYGDIAILCRENTTVQKIASSFTKLGIPYSGDKDGRYRRVPLTRWLEDIASWIKEGWKSGSPPRFHTIYKQYISLINNKYNLQRQNETELSIQAKFFHAIWNPSNLNIPVWQWLIDLTEALSLDKLVEEVGKLDPYDAKGFWEFSELTQIGRSLENLTVADLALCGRSNKSVFLSTLHNSKGLEFDVVMIPDMEQGRLPDYRSKSEEEIAEERRLLYVGITRAKRDIWLLSSGFYLKTWGDKSRDGHSQFLEEIGLNPTTSTRTYPHLRR